MEEHPHKRVLALTIILAIAVLVGFAYYFSARKRSSSSPANSRYSPEVQNALKSLQSKSAKTAPAPAPLTPEQEKALESLGSSGGNSAPAPTRSQNSPSQERAILDSLQN